MASSLVVGSIVDASLVTVFSVVGAEVVCSLMVVSTVVAYISAVVYMIL